MKKIVVLSILIVSSYFVYVNAVSPWMSESSLVQNFDVVCVETGEKFSLHRSEIKMIPTKNPKTDRYTLLPFVVDEKGNNVILGRYRDALTQSLKDVNKYVDIETFEVLDFPVN